MNRVKSSAENSKDLGKWGVGIECAKPWNLCNQSARCSVTQACPTLCDPTDCSSPGSSVHDSPDKNAGVGCHALLQGIFPPRDRARISMSPALADGFFTTSATWDAQSTNPSPPLCPKSVLVKIPLCGDTRVKFLKHEIRCGVHGTSR